MLRPWLASASSVTFFPLTYIPIGVYSSRWFRKGGDSVDSVSKLPEPFAAPAGEGKDSAPIFREPTANPVDTTVHAPSVAKQPWRQTETPCDPGLCQSLSSGKNRRKSVDAGHSRHSRTTTTGILARACVHATLRFYPENGITVFTKGEAVPDAH